MDKGDGVCVCIYTYNGIQPWEKKENTIYTNMNETWGHYIKWSWKKANIVCSHISVEYRKAKLTKME